MVNAIDMPHVCIGMPIYNEERFIHAALASLRAQDYPNLEIVISDNASTDRTFEICQEHAAQDSRILVTRFAENRGASANFQCVLEQTKGVYFMWASGHDLWSPNLVTECVALLEANQSACIAFASSNWIGTEGESLSKSSGWTDTRGLAPAARFFTIFWGNMHPVLGMMRASEIRGKQPIPPIVGGDLVLLSDLALRGDFVHASRATWFRREFRTETSYDDKIKRYKSPQFGIARTRFSRFFPFLALPVALMKVVLKSDIPRLDKFATLIALMPSLVLRYFVGRRKPISPS